MKMTAHKITPCLWFDTQAEEAAKFYVSIFENARIGRTARYGKEGQEIHGKPAGSVMTVEFEIGGQTYVALNGGPNFKFNEAVSLQCIARRRRRSTISGASSARAVRRGHAAG